MPSLLAMHTRIRSIGSPNHLFGVPRDGPSLAHRPAKLPFKPVAPPGWRGVVHVQQGAFLSLVGWRSELSWEAPYAARIYIYGCVFAS